MSATARPTVCPAALVTSLLIALAAIAPARADDWPQWRGPAGQGHTPAKNLPLTWSAKTGENVAWKSPLPKAETPYSSPVVVGGKVFLTLAMNADRAHHVLCFDARDGRELWNTPVDPGPLRLTDVRGGYSAPTPAADADRVYALFGSAALVALDHAGKPLWRYELPNFAAFDVAIGCSPVLVGDAVIIQADTLKKQSALFALDRATGKLLWEAKRPDIGFAHSTPTPVTVGGKPLLLAAASDALQGLDPATGRVLWWAKAKGDTVSPVYSPETGLAYLDSGRGGAGGVAVAVDPAAAGDVTKTHTKWRIPLIPEGFGSPVIVGPHLYRLHAPGILKVYKLADGTETHSQRLEGATPAASPIATADGRVYFASAGISFVLEAGTQPTVLATNNLADGNYASPAVADGAIFLKGRRFLWCIRGK